MFRILTQPYILNEKQAMTILELIKAQCGVSGVDKKYAERIEKISGIKEEKDGNIIAAVKSFKDDILPAIQEAENSGKTAITEYEKTHGLKDGKPVEAKTETEPEMPKDLDPSIKAIIEAQKKSIEDLTALVSGVVKTQKMANTIEVVKAKLKGKVDDKFIERVSSKVNLEAEDLEKEIEAQVTEFNEFKQSLITEYVGDQYIPTEGGKAGDKSVEDWTKLMDGAPVADTGVVDLGLGK